MTDPDKDRRKLWREYHARYRAVLAGWELRGPDPVFPPWPAALDGLRCGAKTRAGTPCKRTDLGDSGRCKLHGGMSTGPTSAEGKARAALNGKAPKRKRSP